MKALSTLIFITILVAGTTAFRRHLRKGQNAIAADAKAKTDATQCDVDGTPSRISTVPAA